MINLRTYQLKEINDVRTEFIKGNTRVVLQAPTGSGKTCMFSFMVKEASARNKRCLILTNRIELLDQAGGTFERLGITYANITAKTKAIPTYLVLVAMVETIKRRALARLDFQILLRSIDILIVDEVHIAAFDTIFTYLKPECYVIGVTATPIRVGKKHLCDNFTALVQGPSISSLVVGGFLSKPKYFGVSTDLSTIKMKAGEFDEKDQERVFGETKVFEGLKENLARLAPGLKTMIFCPSVASSEKVAHDLGCLHIDGTMEPSNRDAILTQFETTPGAILTNCAITTTGYDCPSIECIVLYRATTSLPLYLQMIGRGSRVTETKREFLILDFGMNVQRFGYWHIDRTWSLKPPTKKSKKKDVFPIKFCPKCGAIVGVNVKTCDFCGFIWEKTEKERVFAELQELTYSEVEKRMKGASLEEMEEIRIAKGYKIGYILHKLKTKEEFVEYGKLKGYRYPELWADHQEKIYLQKIAT
jgi:superfamily II DNA or RNA helicase